MLGFFLCISFLIFSHKIHPDGCFYAMALFKSKNKDLEINIEGNFSPNARKRNLNVCRLIKLLSEEAETIKLGTVQSKVTLTQFHRC